MSSDGGSAIIVTPGTNALPQHIWLYSHRKHAVDGIKINSSEYDAHFILQRYFAVIDTPSVPPIAPLLGYKMIVPLCSHRTLLNYTKYSSSPRRGILHFTRVLSSRSLTFPRSHVPLASAILLSTDTVRFPVPRLRTLSVHHASQELDET